MQDTHASQTVWVTERTQLHAVHSKVSGQLTPYTIPPSEKVA
jgi:hypothetical protein